MKSDIRREIALALRQAVRAPIAFCYAASHASETELDGLEWCNGAFAELPVENIDTLANAFQFPQALAKTGARYCIAGGAFAAAGDPVAAAAVPDAAHAFYARYTLRAAGRNALFLYLHAGGALHGMAGLIRYEDDAPFDDADVQHLEQIGPVLSSLTRLHSNVVRLQKPITPAFSADTPAGGIPIAITPPAGVSAVGRSASKTSPSGTPPKAGLSEREQQVARLLADGYSCVNTAAVLNLSENTVRTYVRRLYRKLAVTNRVDLVQRLGVVATPST